jgi:hypothetical protein
MDKIEVVCLKSEAFYKLLDTVIQMFKPSENMPGINEYQVRMRYELKVKNYDNNRIDH